MSFLNGIELPVDWSDITVDEFNALNSIDREEHGFFGYMLERYCILAGIDSDDDRIEDVPIKELNKEITKLKFLNIQPSFQVQKKVQDKKLIPFNKLTLGAFIDLEYYIQDHVKSISKIFAVLYRNYKQDEWGNEIYEPYTFDMNVREAEFDMMHIKELYAVVGEYIKWRNQLIDTYKVLFDGGETNEELTEEETEGLQSHEIQQLKRDIERQESLKKFSWQKLVFDLAGEDITKMKSVFELPALLVFNNMSMNAVLTKNK